MSCPVWPLSTVVDGEWWSVLINHTTVEVGEGAKSTSHLVTNCHWPALTRTIDFSGLPNKYDHVVTNICTQTAPASCCIAPWVMTHATNPLLCIQWRGGYFLTPGGKLNIWFWLQGLSFTPPIFLLDLWSCWQAKSLSHPCKPFSGADGVSWALVWTKRWHRH